MAGKRDGRKTNSLVIIALAGLILLAVLAAIKILMEPQIIDHEEAPPATNAPSADAARDDEAQSVIDYGQLGSDEALKALMARRKGDYDVGQGIDIIARSDETVRIGDNTISMKELEREIQLKLGEIAEENLSPDGRSLVPITESYGIYVVQPGDNIWNIHFRFLSDYFNRQGVSLSPVADEPLQGGLSSGVGKLLKFSENVVYIYNIKDKQFSENLDLIEPHSKIVIYKMDRVFAFLEQVDYEHIDRIRFDGDTLWVTSP